MALNKVDRIASILLVAGIVCTYGGFFLVTQAIDRNTADFPQPIDVDKLHRDELLGRFIGYAGYALLSVSAVAFAYSLMDRWRTATRRKGVKGSVKGEVWFCPSCGNLDIKGSEYCPRCGKPLPKELMFDFH
jgi:ribosomal protein L32